jgi:glycosyltransferase involved in cell wall biosynthesis
MRMKAIVPFLMRHETDFVDSSKVVGGLERFVQLICLHSDMDVVPFYYTDEDRKGRLVTKKLIEFIHLHSPDVVISNHDTTTLTTNVQKATNVPVLWITHTSAGGIFKLKQLETMEEFYSLGGTIAMVSKSQYDSMNKLSRRVSSKDLLLNGGFINSAFAIGNEEPSNEIDWDCVTIGRMDKEKDPFMLHRFAKNSNMKTLVLTSNYVASQKNTEYENENSHWQSPQHILFNLEHKDVMAHLSKSAVYLSTCSRETWGITALEAFSHGIPVILIRNSTNNYKHASEDISPSPEYFEALTTKRQSDFLSAVDMLKKIDRIALSQATKEKHSKAKWVSTLHRLIDKTIENHKKVSEKKVSWFD